MRHIARISLLSSWLLVLLAGGCQMSDREQEALDETADQPPMTARATLDPTGEAALGGEVTFAHHNEGVQINARVESVGADSVYTLYLHEGNDCSAPGAPLSPGSGAASGQDDRPVGRLGTLARASDNTGQYERVDGMLELDGPDAIVDRAVVLYGGTTAGGEQPGPGAGSALACGVVALDEPGNLPDPGEEQPGDAPDPGEQPEPQTQPDTDSPSEE